MNFVLFQFIEQKTIFFISSLILSNKFCISHRAVLEKKWGAVRSFVSVCDSMFSEQLNSYLFSSAADEEEETFTLKEIKEKIKFGDEKSWKPFFKEGVERIEVEQIEKYLTSYAAKEDIRYDFTFYTPSYRDIRVKVIYSCCCLLLLIN